MCSFSQWFRAFPPFAFCFVFSHTHTAGTRAMPKADGAGAAKQMAPELINWTFAGLSMTDDADTRYWQTHNSEAYKTPPVRPQMQGSSRPKHQHSNISQWDLGDAYSAAPPDVHFRTANNLAFSTAHPVQHARPRRSEQYAESFERTRVPIGSTKCARRSAATRAAPPHAPRRHTPRAASHSSADRAPCCAAVGRVKSS